MEKVYVILINGDLYPRAFATEQFAIEEGAKILGEDEHLQRIYKDYVEDAIDFGDEVETFEEFLLADGVLMVDELRIKN